MKIIEAINMIDSLKHNTYSQSEKIYWLSKLDSMAKRLVIDTHVGGEFVLFTGYNADTDLNTDMLIPEPFDDAYLRWLEAQIDYANGEYKKYNNSIVMFNDIWDAYKNYYNRTCMPIGPASNRFGFRKQSQQATSAPSFSYTYPVRIDYVTLFADKWVDEGSRYAQVVELADVTKNSQVDLTPSAEQLVIFHDKDLAFVTHNVSGVVTVYAIGQKPTNDYTIQVTITEVKK